MIQGANTSYELAQKADGTAYGGVAAVHAFAKKIGLADVRWVDGNTGRLIVSGIDCPRAKWATTDGVLKYSVGAVVIDYPQVITVGHDTGSFVVRTVEIKAGGCTLAA